MNFRKEPLAELEILAASGGYSGGTTRTDLASFRSYIGSKKLKDSEGNVARADEAYSACSWTRSTSARSAEDRLLAACNGACPYNVHDRSNLPDGAEGIVYVLHD